MNKYFLYARKSTDVEDKQVLSIEAQLAELRTLAKSEGLEIANEFVEKRTAKMPGRPVFNEMIKRIQKGEAQGIICWKLDRLARNPVDGGQISWMLQQNIIQHIRAHNSHYYSGDNVLMMSVEFGMANQFIRDLSSNVKRGLRAKVKRGEFPSVAPTGYQNDVRTKRIVVDKEKSKVILSAFELYAKGNLRLEDISNFLFENGVKSYYGNILHKDSAKRILSNPFYYGHFRYGGEIHEGRHKPIIEKQLFDKVQKVMIERGNPMKPRSEPKVFCGLLRCGTCGMMVTAENKTKVCKDSIHHYTYYRCTKKSKVMKCSEIAVRQEVLDQQFSEILSNYSMLSPWANEFGLLMEEDKRKGSFESSKIVADVQNRVYDLSEKIQRLLDVYLAQDIDRETYLRERSKLFSDKKNFEEKIEKLERDATHWLAPMQEWVNTASSLGKIAERNDLPSKKSSLQKIFGSNLILHDKKVRENPSLPYAALRAALQNFSPFQTSHIRVAGPGLAPGSLGYEPSELLYSTPQYNAF